MNAFRAGCVRCYVEILHVFKKIFKALGLLSILDRYSQKNRLAHFTRALFAIHDLDDMLLLDVPWWTYPAIKEVAAFLARRRNPTVFEYGSGASTLWLAKRAARVLSVEHDPKWYTKVLNASSNFSNIELMQKHPDDVFKDGYLSERLPGKSFEQYVNAIHLTQQRFDLIIIDGRARVACLKHCTQHLKPGGLIVLDNSNRKRYQHALRTYHVRRLKGWIPSSPWPGETAIITL